MSDQSSSLGGDVTASDLLLQLQHVLIRLRNIEEQFERLRMEVRRDIIAQDGEIQTLLERKDDE